MKFDKTKIYTAVNAEKLMVGSLIIAALNLDALERSVESEIDIQELSAIADSSRLDRFGINLYDNADNLRYYPLAYLVKEKEYEEFDDMDDAIEEINKHGGWIKRKTDNITLFVFGYSDSYIYTGEGKLSLNSLFAFYNFADDGSPCGELAEE